jgi:hypothetical protein
MNNLLIIILITLSCRTVNQELKIDKSDSLSVTGYKISKIDSINEVYIIYAIRNDSIFKIVSEKENGGCKKIKKGHTYDLECQSLITGVSGKLHIAGVKFNGTLIKLEGGKVVWDLFYCENLKGLCLVKKT